MIGRPRGHHRIRVPVVLFTHPLELALALALAINGVRGFLGHAQPSVATLPALTQMLYLLVSTLGGVGLIIGLGWANPTRPTYIKGLAIERSALWLVAVSYAGLAILLVAANGSKGVSSAVICSVVGGACLLRTVAIRRTTKAILNAITSSRHGGEVRP